MKALAFRLGYVAVIVLATIAEPRATATLELQERLARAFAFELSGTSLIDAARNILLFTGWGAVWVLTSPPGPGRPMLLRATLTGALLSATVEIAQLFSPTRYARVLDILTNTGGALLGAYAAAVLVLLLRRGRGRRSYVGIPALAFAASYGAATFVQACFPLLRQRRLPGAWGSPLDRLAVAFQEFPWQPMEPRPWGDVLLFIPAGLLAFAALAELQLRRRRALTVVIGGAAVLFAVAELVRGASGYPMSWQAWLTHVAGVAVGALMAARWLPAFSRSVRGRARPLAVMAGYAVSYALWVLRPFTLDFDLARIRDNLISRHLLPLVAYRERVDLFTTADVLIPALIMLPVGGLLAVWPLRRRGWLAGAVPVIYLAVFLETAQLFIAGRTFDVTDILVGCAAAGVGFAIVRRAGYQPYGEALPQH